MRINRLTAVNRWWPVAMAMPRMQKELAEKPEAGMLWQRNFLSGRVRPDRANIGKVWKGCSPTPMTGTASISAWAACSTAGQDNAVVGIWHESYALTPENCENIYRDMPAFGLGGAFGVTADRPDGRLRDPFARS